MTQSDNIIVSHYTKGDLFDRIMAGAAALGKDGNTLTAEDLKLMDEFHLGGLEATDDLLAQVEIGQETRVLDIGAGVGGPARQMTKRYGARVIGLDLTPEFVETGQKLCQITGLPVEFRVGSALAMPFDDGVFDLATLLHVGMNLPDKPTLFAEAARVLRPGGTFAVYDIMQLKGKHPDLPVPWASTPDGSFLESPESYRAAAAAAGFELRAERERGDFARDFLAKVAAQIAEQGPPPLALTTAMGADAQTKVGNVGKSLNAGDIAPVEMIFRKPG